MARDPTVRSKGYVSNKTALAMVFKLIEDVQKSWLWLEGPNRLPKLIQDKYADVRGRQRRWSNRCRLSPLVTKIPRWLVKSEPDFRTTALCLFPVFNMQRQDD